MTRSELVTVVLPAFNEARAIGRVLRDATELLGESGPVSFVVVDDGSADGTAALVDSLAESLPITLIRHEENRGLGCALATGLLHAARNSDPRDIILTTESDGTQPTAKLLELVEKIGDGHDVCVATPLAGDGFRGVPLYRRFLSRGANVLYSLLFPVDGIRDYTNLVRGLRASILQRAIQGYGPDVLFDRSGFDAVPDLLIKLRRLRPSSAEIGLKIDFTAAETSSSMDVPLTILRSLKLCFRHTFNRPHLDLDARADELPSRIDLIAGEKRHVGG